MVDTWIWGCERARYVQKMFSRIAHRYDLMNRLMTAGQDVHWRREVIRRAGLTPYSRLLDVGAGTGDLAREALRLQPETKVVAADFALEMMRIGKQYGLLDWSAADALHLPFAEGTFEAVVSGFLMRNVGDIQQALNEQSRVLKSGGRVVILDTTRPRRSLLSPLIWVYMHVVIPLVGGWVSGSRDAYTYLPDSTENYLDAEELSACMARAGFEKIAFRYRMFGVIAIHWGEKGS